MERITSERARSSMSVYVVAENRLLRETLVRLFQKRSDILVVGDSRYSDLTADRSAINDVDVLILDSLTALEALDLTDGPGADNSQTKVILFGMDDDPECFLKAVRLGICGYLLKEASSTEVFAAVRVVACGGAVCPPTLCAFLFKFVSQLVYARSGMVDDACGKLGLTYRQRQLLTLVGQGLTNKEIAASLNLSEFTVKNHVSRIMKQLDAGSRHEAANMIRVGGITHVN